MTEDSFYNACREHIVHAKAKHPLFAHQSTDLPAPFYHLEAIRTKRLLKLSAQCGQASIEQVLDCEVQEFLHELSFENLERAKAEAADIVAVLYRALEWIEERANRVSNR